MQGNEMDAGRIREYTCTLYRYHRGHVASRSKQTSLGIVRSIELAVGHCKQLQGCKEPKNSRNERERED